VLSKARTAGIVDVARSRCKASSCEPQPSIVWRSARAATAALSSQKPRHAKPASAIRLRRGVLRGW
jgi:hypothetical protein